MLNLLHHLFNFTMLTQTIILFLFIATNSVLPTATFCSSNCASCTSPSPLDCTACASPLVASSGICAAAAQSWIFSQELPLNASFFSSGYQSASPLNVVKCTGLFDYYMLGTFGGNNSYVAKQFTGLGTNHYQVSILYGYGVMTPSVWTTPIILKITDGATNISLPQTPACTPDALFGCNWSTGCYSQYSATAIPHGSDSLALNFSIPTLLSAGQAWGIHSVSIILALCHASCGSCSGSLSTNCITCAPGLYFSGNICVSSCPYYTIPSTSQCVLACPLYYFLNTANNFCEQCPSNCSACTASDQCVTWQGNVQDNNLFMELIATWIILIIVGLIIIGLLLWRFCISKKSFYSSMEEEVIDHKPVQQQQKIQQINHSHEVMDTHWIEDIDDLHMTKVVKKKLPKDTIEGIGNPQARP